MVFYPSGCNSVGRVTAFQADRRRFKSCHPLQILLLRETAGVVSRLSTCAEGIETPTECQFFGSLNRHRRRQGPPCRVAQRPKAPGS